MKALIDQNNIISQVSSDSDIFEIQSPLSWVVCPDNCEAYSWTYDGINFTKPPDIDSSLILTNFRRHVLDMISQEYVSALKTPVRYTSTANVTEQYQTDSKSVSNLSSMLLAFSKNMTVPEGFYWVALSNAQVDFTYIDLQNLASVIGTAGFTAFARYQTRKAAANAATTISDLESI